MHLQTRNTTCYTSNNNAQLRGSMPYSYKPYHCTRDQTPKFIHEQSQYSPTRLHPLSPNLPLTPSPDTSPLRYFNQTSPHLSPTLLPSPPAKRGDIMYSTKAPSLLDNFNAAQFLKGLSQHQFNTLCQPIPIKAHSIAR